MTCCGFPVARTGWVALPAVLGVLALAACAPGAGPATDWTHTARLSESIREDTNPGLDKNGQNVVTNTVGAGLGIAARTKRGLFGVDLGLAAQYFFGEDEQLAGTGRVDPTVTANAAYRGKRYNARARASVRTQSTAFSRIAELDSTGAVVDPTDPGSVVDEFAVENKDATQISSSADTAFTLLIDPRNQLTFGIDGQDTEFSTNSSGLIPTHSIRTTAAWRRLLSETTTGTLTTGLRAFQSDDGTHSQTLEVKANLTTQRTPRHTFRIGAGVDAVRTTQDPTGGDPQFDLGFVGDAGLDYRLKRLNVSLNLSQSIDPSSTTGDLQSFTRASGTLGYSVNQYQKLQASLNYSRRAPLSGNGGSQQLVSFGPSYSLALGAGTTLTGGYTFRQLEGTATSHQVFLTLAHDLSF